MNRRILTFAPLRSCAFFFLQVAWCCHAKMHDCCSGCSAVPARIRSHVAMHNGAGSALQCQSEFTPTCRNAWLLQGVPCSGSDNSLPYCGAWFLQGLAVLIRICQGGVLSCIAVPCTGCSSLSINVRFG